MIDWISCEIPYWGPRFCNTLLVHDAITGEVVQSRAISKWVEGSHSAKVSISAIDRFLRIDGNPTKFLSGQNYHGTSDITRLLEALIRRLQRDHFLPQCDRMDAALRSGDISLGRVDCTRHIDCKTDDEVDRVLRSIADVAHAKFRGRGHFNPTTSTLYYGRRVREDGSVSASRRSTLKMYNKAKEMKVNKPTCHHDDQEAIRAQSVGKLRCEAQYRSLELKRLGYNMLRDWTTTTADELLSAWMSKLEMGDGVMVEERDYLDMPRGLRSTYLHWKNGEDCLDILARATFYRHRRQLLELYGIDISSPAPSDKPTRIVPVIEILRTPWVSEDDHAFWRMAA